MSTAAFWSEAVWGHPPSLGESSTPHDEPAPCWVHEPQHLCAHKSSLLVGQNFLLPFVLLFKKRFYVSHLS